MSKPVSSKRHAHEASGLAVSKDGYNFDPACSSWKLSKDVIIRFGRAADLPEPTLGGFRATLRRYAEEMSPHHTYNMAEKFKRFLRDTGARFVTSAHLLNWRAKLGESDESDLGGLKGFLLAWHDYGFPGVPDEAAKLLEGWRIKGNEKGVAVASGCPDTGSLSDLEVAALLDWANVAVASRRIEFAAYAYLLTLVMTARRPVQIAALRGKDLLAQPDTGVCLYRINFPRAKQRGGGFRQEFRLLAVVEDLYVVLQEQHKKSVAELEARLGHPLDELASGEVPIFLSERARHLLAGEVSPEAVLNGPQPDALHASTSTLAEYLHACARLSTARSERTGDFIRLSATRFRRTRGTKLRREGFGAFVIAELLDHSDIENVRERAGMDDYSLAQWAGRADPRHNRNYDHRTPDERLAAARHLLPGEKPSLLERFSRRQPVTYQELGVDRLGTAKATMYGMCTHDYAMTPCQKQTECMTCKEHVCIKGDHVTLERLQVLELQTEGLLNKAQQAHQDGLFGADRWVDNHKWKLAHVRGMRMAMENPDVPEGTPLRIPDGHDPSSVRRALIGLGLAKVSASDTAGVLLALPNVKAADA